LGLIYRLSAKESTVLRVDFEEGIRRGDPGIGVQAFRRSGVQAFRRSGVQVFGRNNAGDRTPERLNAERLNA
jgi:hypothetical protein